MSGANFPVPAKRKSWERLGILGVGLLGNQLQVVLFDYVLYPFVIWRAGLLWGALIMTGLSFAVCLALLRFYDWSRRDWLGIETVKRLRDEPAAEGVRQRIGELLRRSDGFALVVLSIRFDPFVTILYIRHGSHAYAGLSRREWRLFLVSNLISNAWWSLVAFGAIEVVRRAWPRLVP
jgi:hypothetical protein